MFYLIQAPGYTLRKKTDKLHHEVPLEPGMASASLTPDEQEPSATLQQTVSNDILATRSLGKTSEEIWSDVRQCRYLRGYDPPIMRINSQTASEFVFGEVPASGDESYKQHLIRVTRLVGRAKLGGGKH